MKKADCNQISNNCKCPVNHSIYAESNPYLSRYLARIINLFGDGNDKLIGDNGADT